jgi:archaellin
MFAIFNNTEDADRTDESPLHSIYTPSQQQQRATWNAELARLEQTLNTDTTQLAQAREAWDTAFPKSLTWTTLQPASVKTESGAVTTVDADGSIKVATGSEKDTYTIEDSTITASPIYAIRLEALTDDSLPGKGPGFASGNFVVSQITSAVIPPSGSKLAGRIVRIELPGSKLLSLAEVQVFDGESNIAVQGEAKQVSTAYGGDAKLAIDGNTNGQFFEAKSTTHTADGKDPWWEVDLGAEKPIDRIAIWNRTDGVSERLSNFKIVVLNDKREALWERTVIEHPNPSRDFAVDAKRTIEFESAYADYSQANFDATHVIRNPDPKNKGWAVGGATGQPHSLMLITKRPIEIPAGSTLSITINQTSSFAQHVLGRFRLSMTADPHASEWAKTPPAVLAALRVTPAERTPEQQAAINKHFITIVPELETTRQQLATVKKSLDDLKPETVPIMKEMKANRRITKVQNRGNFEDLGKEVTEGTPAAFPPLPSNVPADRMALARWLVADDNPLTARVIANRYWEQLFGIGIVASSEEFGSQGDQPVHPELLDWLASELSGQPDAPESQPKTKWDAKAFLKTIVTSATYRQSSKVGPDAYQRDPDNRLLSRGSRFRLSAETLRDQSLFVSGLLSSKMYGTPVKPAQPNLGLSAAFGSSTDWQTSSGEDKYRRGLYTTWRRSNPYPSMATFDAPNREVCTVRRIRTNTPLQALVLLNDPVYIEAAQAFARRIVREGGTTTPDRMVYGFQVALSRTPHENELKRLIDLYDRTRQRFDNDAEDAKKMATDPLGPAPAEANMAELAAWTVVGNVILNLDEMIMKR